MYGSAKKEEEKGKLLLGIQSVKHKRGKEEKELLLLVSIALRIKENWAKRKVSILVSTSQSIMCQREKRQKNKDFK